jgi:hypothetical protein
MLRGSDARLIGLSEFGELRGDELLGAEHLGLPAPVVPLLPEFFTVLFDLSERHLEARQLGFSGRQFGPRLTGFIRPAGEAAATTA